MTRRRRNEGGFSLLEVLLSLAIVSIGTVYLLTTLGGVTDLAFTTKVNRQFRHLSQYQYGQTVIGKLHSDEEDPFLDGQSGDFSDVGGWADEYAGYTWEIRVDEVCVCGGGGTDLDEAGFVEDGSGFPSRPYTDDVVRAASGESGGFASMLGDAAPKPAGQFKKRITLFVRWAGEDAEHDRTFTLTTLVPSDDESKGELPPGGGEGGGPGADGAAGDGGKAGGDGRPDGLKGGEDRGDRR
ncbi:MAG TPA: type II secretion system protein [Planctomycetota bacterium]|nr:type II secretion system protein [Planctomycetota bacterium]